MFLSPDTRRVLENINFSYRLHSTESVKHDNIDSEGSTNFNHIQVKWMSLPMLMMLLNRQKDNYAASK